MNVTREDAEAPKDAFGVIPTRFSTWGPRTVPRVDYERLFVMDTAGELLGEYILNDECPLEFADLKYSIPMSGMRHLVSFYQGDYAFTPFKVDDLWFVMLTRGVPRIEERGYIGTVLAAARIHIPPSVDPALAKRERDLRDREAILDARESDVQKREERVHLADSELRVSEMRVREIEADVRSRETKLQSLREYALEMQRNYLQGPGKRVRAKEAEDPSAHVEIGP